MDTIITSKPEKLPEPVRGLLEETQPLPPGVVFFEQRHTADLIRRVAIAAVLFVVAVVVFFFSLSFLWERGVDPKYREIFNFKAFVFSLVSAWGGWLVLSSIHTSRVLARRQAAGERTRHGVFLLPEGLMIHSPSDTTLIPRERFRGLAGRTVNYLLGDAPKSLDLPAEWVGASPVEVAQAVVAWQQAVPPSAPVRP